MQIIETNIPKFKGKIVSTVPNGDVLIIGLFGVKQHITGREVDNVTKVHCAPGFGAGSTTMPKYAPDGWDNHFRYELVNGDYFITRYHSTKSTGWTAREQSSQMQNIYDYYEGEGFVQCDESWETDDESPLYTGTY